MEKKMTRLRPSFPVALVDSAGLQQIQLKKRLELLGYTPELFSCAAELVVELLNGRRFALLLLEEDGALTWSCVSAVSRVLGIPILLLADTLDWMTQLARHQDFLASHLFDFEILSAEDSELDARLQALLRRVGEGPLDLTKDMSEDISTDMAFGDYVFREDLQCVVHRGCGIQLQPRQFDLALELFRNVGRVVAREALWTSLWGVPWPKEGTRALEVCVANVRKKLQLRAENGFMLSAVYGRGYQLRAIGRCPAPESLSMGPGGHAAAHGWSAFRNAPQGFSIR